MNKIKNLLDKVWFRWLLIILLLSLVFSDILYRKYKEEQYNKFLVSMHDNSSNYKYVPYDYFELKQLVDNESVSLADIDVSNISYMTLLFHNSTRKDFSGIENWNVSNVLNMTSMFEDAKYFNADISKWDTSNVERMNSMFKRAESFNQDISSWKTFYVEDMYQMFAGAVSFNQDLSNWDISNVEDMRDMFQGSPMENNPPAWYKK